MKLKWLINPDKFPGHYEPMPHEYFADITKV